MNNKSCLPSCLGIGVLAAALLVLGILLIPLTPCICAGALILAIPLILITLITSKR